MKIQAIAKSLGGLGVRVSKVVITDEPEVEDSELKITEEVGVQVGSGYLIANRWSEAEEAMYSGPSRQRTRDGVTLLAADLKTMLADAQACQAG